MASSFSCETLLYTQNTRRQLELLFVVADSHTRVLFAVGKRIPKSAFMFAQNYNSETAVGGHEMSLILADYTQRADPDNQMQRAAET